MSSFNSLLHAQFPFMQYFSAWLSNILNVCHLKEKPYLHEHQRLGSSWLSGKIHFSESWKELFKMVMVDKALEEIALQAHWHGDILKNTRSITDPFRHSSAVFLFSSTPLLIWAPSNPVHHTRGAIAVIHFQPCGQLSPALSNIHHWIPGSLQLEKVFEIKSNIELNTAKPSSVHSIPEQYQGTSPGCSTCLAHLQWIPW